MFNTDSDRLPYADNISSFISIRAPLKCCRIFSSDMTGTADSHETNNFCTPPASQTSSEIRGLRRDHPTPPQKSGEQTTRNIRKESLCFASSNTKKISGIEILNSLNNLHLNVNFVINSCRRNRSIIS
ncbi:hypothetical protein TNCV_1590341 [Trichonephila clavipes]|nr:hypothetical protein TNCV_1590341 [Trichonephila clavipes]